MDEPPTIRDLYPDYTEQELAQAECNLERYLVLVLRIYERRELEKSKGVDFESSTPLKGLTSWQDVVKSQTKEKPLGWAVFLWSDYLPEAASFSSQQQDIPRTCDRILDTLSKLNTQHLLPDLSFMSGFKHHGDSIAPKVADRDNNSAVV